MKKQDTEADDAKPSTAGGFGNVLGSIQGLQQRLGDFSYGEVSIAEAKVKMLVKQLALLGDSLTNLLQLKLAIAEINRRMSEIPAASFDQINLDSLEKHPQLHAILQASKLMRAQRLMKGDLAGPKVTPLKIVTANPTNHALATKEVGTKSTVERARSVDKQQPTEAIGSTRRATGDAWVEDLSAVAEPRIAPQARETFTTEEEPPSFTIPNETLGASQDDQAGCQTKDWSFDLHETVPSASESFTTPINFVFPAETVVDPEPLAKSFSKTKLPHSEPPPIATITKTPPNKPTVIEAKAAVTAQAAPAKPAPEKAKTSLDESKALVPANHEFDQRLLEDVIKNYGDFAGAANLPATLDTSTKLIPVTDTPAKPASAQFAQPTAAERKVLNVQKSGDLDRQLKKIIKDYGEYDIYERKAVVNLKTGGIIAFAVLGLVLAVLYLFKAPAAVSTPQTGSVAQPQVAERRILPEAVKSPGAEENPIGPDAVSASSSPLTDGKQKP